MTTPTRLPVRAKVQRELGGLASEARAIETQLAALQAQLEANHARAARLHAFLETLAEFEEPEPPAGRCRHPAAPPSGGGVAASPPAAPVHPAARPERGPGLALPVALPFTALRPPSPPATPAASPDRIREFVARELAAAGELSTRDLVERLEQQGFAIPGAEAMGDLSAILSGSTTFRNENRLWYLVRKTMPGADSTAATSGRADLKPGSGPAAIFGSSGLRHAATG